MDPPGKPQCPRIGIILLIIILFFIGVANAGTSANGTFTLVQKNVSFDNGVNFRNYGVTVFNDKLWIIGGEALRGGNYCYSGSYCGGRWILLSDVWSSSYDGKTWTLVTSNPGFSPRKNPGVTVFNNRLWVVGGTDTENSWSYSGTNDVWSSADGVHWEQETADAGFSPRGDLGLVGFHNRLWVIGGGNHTDTGGRAIPGVNAMTDDVWSSPDGRSWVLENEHAGFGPHFGYGVTTFNDKIWMVAGRSDITKKTGNGIEWFGGGSQDVWATSDGRNWTLITDNAPFGLVEFAPVVIFANKLWIIGGDRDQQMECGAPDHSWCTSPEHDWVWSSPDGANWTLEMNHTGYRAGYTPVVVFQEGIWSIGRDIWYLPAQKDVSGQELSDSNQNFSEPSPLSTPSNLSAGVPYESSNQASPSPRPTKSATSLFLTCASLLLSGALILVKKNRRTE